jgi:hypothetical protein
MRIPPTTMKKKKSSLRFVQLSISKKKIPTNKNVENFYFLVA